MVDLRYALILFMSIISFIEITSTDKQPSDGELNTTYFSKQRKKEYVAVVCEINGNDYSTAEKRVKAVWELQSSYNSISNSDCAKDSTPSCMSGRSNASIPPSNTSNNMELPSNSSSDNKEISHFSPRRKSIRNCQSCIELKIEIEKLKQELASGFVQRVNEVDEASLIKVINDKCSHCRQGKNFICSAETEEKREQSKTEKMTKWQKQKSADISTIDYLNLIL